MYEFTGRATRVLELAKEFSKINDIIYMLKKKMINI